ncbi:class F sortase [Paenibacillus sp. GCM10027627]
MDNGQMDVPASAHSIGLLSPGIMPGEPGTAVMAGHVDDLTGPAVFYSLTSLKVGDHVVVSNAEGKSLLFQVIMAQSYPTNAAPIDQIFGDTEEARLHLITCTGKYDRKTGNYDKRLVVYTRLIE